MWTNFYLQMFHNQGQSSESDNLLTQTEVDVSVRVFIA